MSTPDFHSVYRRWLDSPALSREEWAELEAISGDERQIEERFFAPLSFGTAGLRGVMGAGLHRMNVHVIRHATQAFADLIVSEGDEARRRGVCICYDCRCNSEQFACEAACVMAANGVRVRLFSGMRPTPELSFAVRHYGAQAGINITASHNPKEYNGYKVYWSDGAQLPPEHAARIAARMERLDVFRDVHQVRFEDALAAGRITWMGEETDEAFLQSVLGQAIDPGAVAAAADTFRVVYTPFHGTGRELVPEALRRLGLKQLFPVAEQMVPDGTFPTVVSPNPENPEGFYLAADLARRVGSDLIIGTDPDADRIGVLVREGDAYVPITGNQLGVLLLDYIIRARRRTGTMPDDPIFLKTIVTTEMARVVAEQNGVRVEETFTGFKFMAERLAELAAAGKPTHYLLAYEESYGYMMGDYVRDKDAVTASMLITEMAAWYAGQGMTLREAMDALYELYGAFDERTLNLVMPGLDGLRDMQRLMERLHSAPPAELGGTQVLRTRDYLAGTVSIPGLGPVEKTPISGSDVLYFELADGTSFIIRPSGTEPKIKIYLLARGGTRAECAARIAHYVQWIDEQQARRA